MKDMNQLKDLLKHEIQDLCSAEEQIIDALPKMIDKAGDAKLKQALRNHLEVTETQRERLDEVLEYLNAEEEEEKKGGILGLFKGDGKKKCKGMAGLISEGEDVMKEDMTADVMDAAIIACAQKIEHYEICAYGTTRAYAEELNLNEVERLLRQTLDEEYESDDLLTAMAMGRLNLEAINERGKKGNKNGKNSSGSKRATSSSPRSESRTGARATTGAKASNGATSKAKGTTQTTKKKTKTSSR